MNLKTILGIAVATMLTPAFASANTYNVIAYGADPSGMMDSAPAFQAAVALAEADNGGTIYVPSGKYTFSTTQTGWPCNVVIKSPGIHIVGDAGSDTNSGGGVTITQTDGTDVFYVTKFGGGNAPSNTIFENMRITYSGKNSAFGPGAGIRFEMGTGNGVTIGQCLVRNVAIDHMAVGLSTNDNTRAATLRSRLASLTVQGCLFNDNSNDGMCVEEFSDLKIIGTEFVRNGKNGLNIHTYVIGPIGGPYNGNSEVGGAFIQSCVMRGNGNFTTGSGAGFQCRGETDLNEATGQFNVVKNVHVSSCQMSANAAQGFTGTQVVNLQVQGCTISSNLGGAGNYLGNCTNVTVQGCTFDSNLYVALKMTTSSGVTVASSTFSNNGVGSGGVRFYSLQWVYGTGPNSFSNLTFTGPVVGGLPPKGVYLIGAGPVYPALNPRNLLMQGLNFSDDYTAASAVDVSAATSSAQYYIQYYRAGTMTVVQQP